jgi:hypothetical protein
MPEPFKDQAHEMTLDERRALFMRDVVHAEDNFAEGSVSRQYLDFFKYLQTNTDLFDTVMVRMVLETDPQNRDALRLNDEAIKEIVLQYLDGELTLPLEVRRQG